LHAALLVLTGLLQVRLVAALQQPQQGLNIKKGLLLDAVWLLSVVLLLKLLLGSQLATAQHSCSCKLATTAFVTAGGADTTTFDHSLLTLSAQGMLWLKRGKSFEYCVCGSAALSGAHAISS
jgi:hypothetical protein